MTTKKIGILFGMENSFPWAFIEEVNRKGLKNIQAEAVKVDMVDQGVPTDYAVIIDRISQDVPFYRAYLKNAAISGAAVLNNPFWWSADEKFFNSALATKVGVPVPRTVILPSFERPTDTKDSSFRNLEYPLSWEKIFDHIGFPAYMKPHAGGGWKSVYKIHDREDFFRKYHETGQLVMLLQEEIVFEEYFRCYCLGRKYTRLMQYEPRNPHHLRYVSGRGPAEKKLLDTVQDYVLRLNNALGYDFNTVEFAVRDGIPYAIDFCNPAPDADVNSVGQENFDWVVENAAKMAIERAQSHKDGADNLTWGGFIQESTAGKLLTPPAKPSKPTAEVKEEKATAPKVEKTVEKTTVKKTKKAE
jgi:glutathione synthase/RimK-type ligase-like ATP-grasp enzyme